MAAPARSLSVSRDQELQEQVRKDALEVLSMQIGIEASQRAASESRDSTWSLGLLGLAIGAGLRSMSRSSRSS